LLLLFGMRWLRKAMLRSAGVIALRDEAAAYDREAASLRTGPPAFAAWDRVAVATAFNITMVEGLEVVFIVIAVGSAGRLLVPASLGAAAALLFVMLLGIVLHRPVSTIPENLLKFGVGVLLCAFGTFWVGEGFGLAFPGGDWSLPGLVLGYMAAALAGVAACRQGTPSGAGHVRHE
jgi:uncharacterized membrane protein